MAKQTLIATIF